MSILLNTRLRKNLLTYIFTHHEENYYVRELSVLIDEDPGNLSRELRRLEEEGLCRSVIRGREKFYSLNKGYSMYNELKNIVSKTEGVEASIKELVLKYNGIKAAFIYGSYASNKDKKASDIDLAVVGKFPQDKFTQDIRSLESRLNREINFSVYSEGEFNKEKEKEGGFLNIVLNGEIITLKGMPNA